MTTSMTSPDIRRYMRLRSAVCEAQDRIEYLYALMSDQLLHHPRHTSVTTSVTASTALKVNPTMVHHHHHHPPPPPKVPIPPMMTQVTQVVPAPQSFQALAHDTIQRDNARPPPPLPLPVAAPESHPPQSSSAPEPEPEPETPLPALPLIIVPVNWVREVVFGMPPPPPASARALSRGGEIAQLRKDMRRDRITINHKLVLTSGGGSTR